MKRVGIHDVARAAGVSPTTVSHALNGRGQVSAETRSRVERAATELGYSPNRIASALRRQRTGVIGFVSDEIATTPFAGRILLGAQDASAELGTLLMVVNSNGDAEVERAQIGALLAQRVDAIVYASMSHRRSVVPTLLAAVPTVLVNTFDPESEVVSVVPDEEGIGYTAAQRMLEAGHRSIVHLSIEQPGPAVEGRQRGYEKALTEAGAEAPVVRVPGRANAAAGRAALRLAVAAHPDLTGVVCFNDLMAMGVYQVASIELDLPIPERLSVIGVDNLETVAAQLQPGLTTVALPHYEMGRWGLARAAALAADRAVPVEQTLLPGPLVERDSVGPAAAAVAPALGVVEALDHRYRTVSSRSGAPRVAG
jgi:LacI family transcriptional regulator